MNDLRWFGFEMETGRTVEIEAATLRDAMALVEAEYGAAVVRGRCLDGFDNGEPGRADLARKAMFDEISANR